MRWSLRTTMSAIVMPLVLTTLVTSAVHISDLVTIRADITRLQDSAYRSILVERYARSVQALLDESFDALAGRSDGLDGIDAARARMIDTLVHLRPFVSERPGDDSDYELTTTILSEWEQTQEQIEIYTGRALALAEQGQSERARRLVMEDLETLVQGRIFSSLDRILQRERELLEEHRVRATRATEHWLARYAGAGDLREQLLPAVYEAILAERLARTATTDLKEFRYYVIEGRPLGSSHGLAASETSARLSRLQRAHAEEHSSPDGEGDSEGPEQIHARIHDAYMRVRSLPSDSLRSNGAAILQKLDEVFALSLVPQIDATVWASERAIDRELAQLDEFAQGAMGVIIAMAGIVLLLGIGSPFLVSHILVRPVIDLTNTLTLFREGRRDARPRLNPANELGLLGSSLRALLDDLQNSDRKLRALSFYDGISGLPNRHFFQERLEGALVKARLEKRSMVLFALNVTGLRQVNETIGHKAGDELLRLVATRLCESVRMTDIVSHQSEEESDAEVSRLGSEEFTILLTKVSMAEDATIAAQRVLAKFAEPFVVDGRELELITSIGIGLFPQDATDAESLLRDSRAAMNHAMKRGGNDFQFSSESMNLANSRRLHIQSRLGGAIDRDDLTLDYQPMRDSTYGHVTGAEALLRWTDAEMGPIGPDEFIPIAETSGLISRLGRWVLTRACTQARAWEEAGYKGIRVSVNVSARQLRDANWVQSVADTLRDTGLSAASLELEITETMIIQEDPLTIGALTEISRMGVGIVLDDFGTGYSSLSHLRSLPINRVKIDRSFVAEISEDGEGTALVGGIIALAKGLELEVVAEGVETHGQASFLRSCGCDDLQGFLISRALPPDELERYLERQKSDG